MSGARSRRELFVWYRVGDEHADRVRVEVETMQRTLEAEWPGLHARLLVRHGESGSATWMETYAVPAADPTGIDDAMQGRIETAAALLRRWLASDRHVESFDLAERG